MKQEILKFYHTTMMGWRVMTINGKLIPPPLILICKIWHLAGYNNQEKEMGVDKFSSSSLEGDDVSCKLNGAYISIIVQLFIENKLFNVNIC